MSMNGNGYKIIQSTKVAVARRSCLSKFHGGDPGTASLHQPAWEWEPPLKSSFFSHSIGYSSCSSGSMTRRRHFRILFSPHNGMMEEHPYFHIFMRFHEIFMRNSDRKSIKLESFLVKLQVHENWNISSKIFSSHFAVPQLLPFFSSLLYSLSQTHISVRLRYIQMFLRSLCLKS